MEEMNNEQPTITIDDKTYLLSDLHVEAQAMVARIQSLRSQQQQLQMQMIENERAINGWAEDIKNSIQVVDDGEEAVQ
tara:strand:- start:4481 stop:4714 length:234 start_codon:yes stop_codon:yes gene_type:complete